MVTEILTRDAAAPRLPSLPVLAAPGRLIARPGLGRIYLSWDSTANDNACGCIVRRARADGGAFKTIAEWRSNTVSRHLDFSPEPGVAYRYAVATRNQSGISPDSPSVVVTAGAPGPLPEGWGAGRLGVRDAAAAYVSSAYSEAGGRTLSLEGSGEGIGGVEDDASFASRKIHGDFELIARLAAPTPDELIPPAILNQGLMARLSLASDALFVALTLGQDGRCGPRMRFRAKPGIRATVVSGKEPLWAPVWCRLRREGNNFFAAHSRDGKTWFEVGRAEITMPAEVFVGFVACAKEPGERGVAFFESIALKQ